ncbi:MAG: FkbM family methyltransferase [Patescibacteria group bacterium]|jgi:FkbM family methyltransferase
MNEKTLKKYILKNSNEFLIRIKKTNPPFDLKKKNKIILFGADILGDEFLKVCKLNNIEVMAFCDNDKTKKGKEISGVKIISIKELMKYPKNTLIIITIMHDFVVKEQLRKIGYKNVFSHTFFASMYPKKFNYFTWKSSSIPLKYDVKKILELYKILEDKKSKKVFEQLIINRLTLDHNALVKVIDKMEKEYFDPSIIKLIKNEVFVDGGGFDGDTVRKFIKVSHRDFSQIHTFEPDKKSQNKIKLFLKKENDKRIELHPFGLSNKNQTAFFSNNGTAGSKVNNKSDHKIKLVSLDQYLYNQKPTLIKFDIEGSETKAILGMKKIMKDFKPKLVICLYHKPSDIWKIPLLIKKINPKYKIFIRHYTLTQHDTVCYAI